MSRPLDVATMTHNEILETLRVTDMDVEARVDFFAYMSAWSRAVLPGPNQWWIAAILYIAQWRKDNTNE